MNTIVSDTSAREAANALLPFTSHSIGCAIYQRSWVGGEPPCTCGLDEARAILASLPSLSGEWVLVPRAAVDFLMGEDHWPDHPEVWFGDAHPTMRGAFWWRSAIRGMLNVAPPAMLSATPSFDGERGK